MTYTSSQNIYLPNMSIQRSFPQLRVHSLHSLSVRHCLSPSCLPVSSHLHLYALSPPTKTVSHIISNTGCFWIEEWDWRLRGQRGQRRLVRNTQAQADRRKFWGSPGRRGNQLLQTQRNAGTGLSDPCILYACTASHHLHKYASFYTNRASGNNDATPCFNLGALCTCIVISLYPMTAWRIPNGFCSG